MKKELLRRINDPTIIAGVVGLGYVGLPLAVEKAKAGFKTIGFDIQGTKVDMVNRGHNYIGDVVDSDLAELVKSGNYTAMEMLYDDIPDTLSQLIRTAFVPKAGMKFIVSDFSAIEARVLSWLAGENWRLDVFKNGGDIYCASASQMFRVPVEKHGVNGHLRQKGKIAELALGYGGSVGALKAMGALEMGLSEDELQPLVDMWRNSNPNIVQFWWEVDRCVKQTVKERIPTETHGIRFNCQSGMLFITLPSGRRLFYVKPRIGENKFGGESVTYEGIGGAKKWERIESYGPKFVENIVQAISRDILCYAMRTLQNYRICGHVHDELIIECPIDTNVYGICEMMGRTPPWAKVMATNVVFTKKIEVICPRTPSAKAIRQEVFFVYNDYSIRKNEIEKNAENFPVRTETDSQFISKQITQEEFQRDFDYYMAQRVAEQLKNAGLISIDEFNKLTVLNRRTFLPMNVEILPKIR